MQIRAIIFDLDDTLYSERDYAFSGFSAVAAAFEEQLGPPAETETSLRRLFDTEHRTRVFNELSNEIGLAANDDLVERMITMYRRHIPDIRLHPDADAALTRLRPTHKLGIITDGRLVTQSLKLKALGLHDRVDKVIITSELGPGFGKPHPRAFEWMSKSLDVEHAACAYVADNPAKDFIAPNALGWFSIQIVRPHGIYRNESSPADGQPDHVVSTLDQVEEKLA